MRLLYLTHTCPYPPNKGERIRCFNILKHLSRQYEVEIIYPSFSHDHADCKAALLRYCRSVKTAYINPLLAYMRCLPGLLTKQPLTTPIFYSKKLERLIQVASFDLVLVDCSSMARYVLDEPIPKILDFVDIDSEKWKQYATTASFPKNFIYGLEAKRLVNFEAKLCRIFDSCLVVSNTEKQLVKDKTNVVVVANGIDLQFFTPQRKSSEHILTFTGAMNYRPNVDGVIYFHNEILPLIRKQIPTVKFIIAGMQPSAKIRALADDHTIVTGFVPDIREYLSKADVCVVPLRIAKGIQNKILEAMAMKVPVVATSNANNGINATDKTEIMLADSSYDFANATVRLMKDTKLRDTITKNARDFVEKNFCWERNLETLDNLISFIGSKSMAHKDTAH
jgi:polysaccharide biosynthesis protein PslH